MNYLRRMVVRYLRDVADSIDTGTSEITETEAMDIMKVVAHKSLSKEQACNFLNLQRSRFDELVRGHKLPKGRKVTGYKELRWYEDELEMYKKR
jgi:predicted DNA-binding transcriptional regulator AlpA